MYGLKAIEEAHGWTITFLGMSVVFIALAFLSLFMANLNRILDFAESLKSKALKGLKSKPKGVTKTSPIQRDKEEKAKIRLSPHHYEMMRYFELITQKLGEPFSLQEVLEKAQDRGIPQPYSALYMLVKKGIIVECRGKGLGYYCWKKDIDISLSETESPDLKEARTEG